MNPLITYEATVTYVDGVDGRAWPVLQFDNGYQLPLDVPAKEHRRLSVTVHDSQQLPAKPAKSADQIIAAARILDTWADRIAYGEMKQMAKAAAQVLYWVTEDRPETDKLLNTLAFANAANEN